MQHDLMDVTSGPPALPADPQAGAPFDGAEENSFEHDAVFRAFQALVEQQLETMLQRLGCSPQRLQAALESSGRWRAPLAPPLGRRLPPHQCTAAGQPTTLSSMPTALPTR